jgi:hypothetical protein
MEIDRRALYNSLRISWLLNPKISVEPWQVEDYRSLSSDALFERLDLHDIALDRPSFLELSDQFDTPEALTDSVLEDLETDATTEDQVYLLLFELWRRFVPEKPCLSIFCDELDHQIYLYDHGLLSHPEEIEDALANLQILMDENADEGADPHEIFQMVASGCANDLESFLYDFIIEQIEAGNEPYASELLDAFYEYVQDSKWFDFLKARLLSLSDQEAAMRIIREVLSESPKDLEFYLETLTFMIQAGGREDFIHLVKKTIPLLESESDLQDLLSICAEFYQRLDRDSTVQAIHEMINSRDKMELDAPVSRQDPQLRELLKILS